MGVEIFRDGDAVMRGGKRLGWTLRARRARRLRQFRHDDAAIVRALAGQPFKSELDGDSSLRQRPMQRVIDPLRLMGAEIRSKTGNGLAPLEIRGGGLHGIHYRMPIASAQVKSAILWRRCRRKARPHW